MAPIRRKKNVSREIRDIRFPTSHVPERPAASEAPVRTIRPVPSAPRAPIGRRRFPARPLLAFLAVALVAVLAGAAWWYRGQVARAGRVRQALIQALHMDGGVNLSGTTAIPSGSIGDWLAFVKDAFSTLGDTGQSSWDALGAIGQMQGLAQDIPSALLEKDGPRLVTDLEQLRDSLASVRAALQNSKQSDAVAGGASPLADFAQYEPDLERLQGVVNGLLALLKAPGDHRLLILLGNSAELRPGGGFLGSFGEVRIGNSAIGDLTLHDVNEVDRGLAADIIPPKPLQGLVGRWRAADANWFFDYPTSAKKTLDLMSRSSFYASTTLDGAILISPNVIRDFLSVTGPVTLADGTTTVNADTIIPMIQREVQAGQASGAANPKAILSELVAPLETALAGLDADAQDRLTAMAENWIKNKDVAVFMRDPDLAKALAYYHADGGLYATPANFSGDYIAAVNANVGGGKSDAKIADRIEFESDLRADGVIQDRVTVTRASAAKGSDEWWYRVANQDYLQIFTPPGAELTAASGGKTRSTARGGFGGDFEADPEVSALEATLSQPAGIPAVSQFRESGKNVFATWITVPAGGKAAATFEYRQARKEPFRDGGTYTFVFERQSGAVQAVHAVLNAPPGFVWQESGTAKYEYDEDDAPGTINFHLTLKAL